MNIEDVKRDMMVYHITNPNQQMLITWVYDNGKCNCEWVGRSGDFHSETISVLNLQPAYPEITQINS